jgi:hypothetical protein
MNLYLHYGVGHKQYVLKSNDQARFNPEQTIKYNLLNTKKKKKKKKPKAENYCQRKPPPETARVTHELPPNNPLQHPKTKNP